MGLAAVRTTRAHWLALGDIPGCARAYDFFTRLLKYIYHTVSKHLLTDMSPLGQVVRNLYA